MQVTAECGCDQVSGDVIEASPALIDAHCAWGNFYSLILQYIMFFFLFRLFANFSMETVIATAFGQRVEVQQGESSVLVKAVSEFFYSFQDNGGLGIEEFSMLLCMFHSEYCSRHTTSL